MIHILDYGNDKKITWLYKYKHEFVRPDKNFKFLAFLKIWSFGIGNIMLKELQI